MSRAQQVALLLDLVRDISQIKLAMFDLIEAARWLAREAPVSEREGAIEAIDRAEAKLEKGL